MQRILYIISVAVRKSGIESARDEIVRFFDALPTRVHRLSDIVAYLEREGGHWRLPGYTSTRSFLKFLKEKGRLAEIVFPFPAPYKERYVTAGGTCRFTRWLSR